MWRLLSTCSLGALWAGKPAVEAEMNYHPQLDRQVEQTCAWAN